MSEIENYGIGPCILNDLQRVKVQNERDRLRNIESERQYRLEVEKLNRSTDREINETLK